jgi:hypothetical protein
MPDAVIDGRALNDEEPERQDDSGADDEHPALMRQGQRRGTQAGAAVEPPFGGDIAPGDRSGDDRVTQRRRQQQEKGAR